MGKLEPVMYQHPIIRIPMGGWYIYLHPRKINILNPIKWRFGSDDLSDIQRGENLFRFQPFVFFRGVHK